MTRWMPTPLHSKCRSGESGVFVGIVDLVEMNAYRYEGFTRIQVPIPAMMMDFVVRKRRELVECLSEFDQGVVR